ncbi:hypothetical protein [Bacillus massiliglaciei]|uniref:hypothetical protein n=1 Tax=Bacillus massiliglaciei TaxID=1816693 RepID=UPI000DA6120F|nr:hypothetical protein [Bacillus massiliglaciei]
MERFIDVVTAPLLYLIIIVGLTLWAQFFIMKRIIKNKGILLLWVYAFYATIFLSIFLLNMAYNFFQ